MNIVCDLLSKFVAPGGIVLDPFGGTGAFGLACMRTGRPYIALEEGNDPGLAATQRARSYYHWLHLTIAGLTSLDLMAHRPVT